MDREPVVVGLAGQPLSQLRARVRVVSAGGRHFPHFYDPPESKRYKADIATLAKVKMAGRDLLLGPVSLTVEARMGVPAGWPPWKREAALEGQIEPTGVPDLDNLEKAAKDALKGIVWKDDSQVVETALMKRYHPRPALWIKVEPRAKAPSNISRKSDLEAWLK